MLTDHPHHLGALGYLADRCAPEDTRGFFAVSSVRPIHQYEDRVVEGRGRCDVGALGPYGFHRWDPVAGVCNCGSTEQPDPTMGHHVLTMANLSFVTIVADALPHGYVLYFEVDDPEVQAQALTMRHTDCALTLQELLRLMWEWSQAHTLFGSTELVAVTCYHMLAAWALPEAVLDWLGTEVPPQAVERFLRGDSGARGRADGVPAVPAEVDAWLEGLLAQASALGEVRA